MDGRERKRDALACKYGTAKPSLPDTSCIAVLSSRDCVGDVVGSVDCAADGISVASVEGDGAAEAVAACDSAGEDARDTIGDGVPDAYDIASDGVTLHVGVTVEEEEGDAPLLTDAVLLAVTDDDTVGDNVSVADGVDDGVGDG
jgi:hypothetical protein